MTTLRIGEEPEFQTLREFLSEVGFNEQTLLQRFSLPKLDWLFLTEGQMGEHVAAVYADDSPLVYVTRILLGGYPTTEEEAARILPQQVFQALCALGLLVPHEHGLLCPISLYPSMGYLITSDRLHGPLGPAYMEDDMVMNMGMNLAQRYVEGIGTSPCARALEIGTGAGLGAIKLSQCAETVWATDITERSVHFTKFNLRLNGITNVNVVRGDMFAPVQGMTFDRIASHPPFEPSVKSNLIYCSGGADGEDLLKRFVADCPAHLNPGGRAYLNIAGTDRENEQMQERIQQWLGAAAGECDLSLFVRFTASPMDYARELVIAENRDPALLSGWEELYERLRVEQVLIGYLIIQKHGEARPAFSTRRYFGKRTTLRDAEWLVDWETRARRPGFKDSLRESRPVPCDGWQLLVNHSLVDGKLSPVAYTIVSGTPFRSQMQCPVWVPKFAAQCDGKSTLAQLYQRVNGASPLEETEYWDTVCTLVGSGILTL